MSGINYMSRITSRIIALAACVVSLPVATDALLGLRMPSFRHKPAHHVSLKSVQNDGLPTIPFDAVGSSLKALIQDASNVIGNVPSIGLSRSSSSIASTKFALPQVPPLPTDATHSVLSPIPPAFFEQPTFQEFSRILSQLISHVDPSTRPLLFAPLAALTAGSLLNAWSQIGTSAAPEEDVMSAPYSGGQGSYNDAAAQEFYRSRPLLVIKRLVTLAQLTGVFNMKLLIDFISTPKGAESWVNEKDRAKEALVLANLMGPTFIKLGQAASIRTDLIPEPYALELRQLQDAVPPFDNDEALEVLRSELGVASLDQVFLSISSAPVASASIGQVYRGTLLDGREVAVKVQRPSVLSDIALDLFILRLITPLQVRISNAINKVPTDDGDIATALALVDEWGRGFVAEVDYRLEAFNTKQFKEAMAARGLNAVTAPTVLDEYSTSTVLVTEWVEGTRLDRDASDDVPRLCGVAINAYLTMLLDTGTLHCDPHPGNLLRTADGRLCVLDWGMTLQVPTNLQYGLLEFISHVNSENYDAIPADFVNLGFTPPEQLDRVKSSGITEGLTFTLQLLSKGGGANKIRERLKEEFTSRYGEGLSEDEMRSRARAEMLERMEDQLASEGVDVNQVTNVMEEMSRRNKELFKLPPYVLYVSRAFSTLEGIGLSIDEDYAILQECYPYLARRLLTDNSPRAREALRSMLYGPSVQHGGDAVLSLSEAVARGAQTPSAGAKLAATAVARVTADSPPLSHQGPRHAHKGERKQGRARQGGLLSPGKLAEMAEGFTTYTAATSDADLTGKGMSAAILAFADLILADFDINFDGGVEELAETAGEGSAQANPATEAGGMSLAAAGGDGGPNLVQEVLVEEAARLLDAAAVTSLDPLRQAAARLPAVRMPGQGAYEALEASLPPPARWAAAATIGAPLRLSKRLSAAAQALEPLVTKTDEDEQVIAAAGSLREALAQTVPPERGADGKEARRALTPGAFSETTQAAAALLLDRDGSSRGGLSEEGAVLLSRLRDKGPAAAANLSRLLAAALVERAAQRLEGATQTQVASGRLDENGDVMRARRSAATAVLDPLLSAVKGGPGQ